MQLLIFEKGRYHLIPMRLPIKITWTYFILLLSCGQVLQAQSVKNFQIQHPLAFEENKGQLRDSTILFYGRDKGLNLYCFKDHIAFVFEKHTTYRKTGKKVSNLQHTLNDNTNDSVLVNTRRMEMQFVQCNDGTQLFPDEPHMDYNTYYLPQYPNGIISHTFNKITYKSIYPNIDLELNTSGKGIEYAFIVHPGGNAHNIRMQWKGADSLNFNTEQDTIKYANNLGFLLENGLQIWSEGHVKIQGKYQIENNIVSFNVGAYDKSQLLIIDPNIVWCTYYGGGQYDEGDDVAIDMSRNTFITGVTLSPTNIATSGAFQNSIIVGYTPFLAKFSPSGSRLWGTYFGTVGYGFGVAVDPSGNAIITGQFKTNNGQFSPCNFQSVYGGGYDAFVAKFSTSGSLSWATYFGGSSEDAGYGIATDKNSNIFITGLTKSSSDIAFGNSYQAKLKNNINGFLAAFDASGYLNWSTYLGNDSTIGNGITTDRSDNVIVIGGTTSKTGIASSGAFQSVYGKGSGSLAPFGFKTTINGDAFIAKFSSSGNNLWSTYFGDTGDEFGEGLTTDSSNNIYIVGWTSSSKGIASTGAFQTSCKGYTDAFIAKFSATGSRLWSTYYGNTGYDFLFDVGIGKKGAIFVTGFTSSSSGITTSGAFQTKFKGGPYDNTDVFIAKFSNPGNRIWSTYFGGDRDDYGLALVSDSTSFYIDGLTKSFSDIATSGSFQSSTGGTTYPGDAFLAKFKEYKYDAGITDIFGFKDSSCSNKRYIQVNLKNFGNSDLDSVKITASINRIPKTMYSWSGLLNPDSTKLIDLGLLFFPPGQDTLKIWTSKPNGYNDSVPQNDTSALSYIVFQTPSANAGGNHSICFGNSIHIGSKGDSTLTYSWSSKPIGFADSVSDPNISPKKTTVYYLTATNRITGCSAVDSAVITVNPLPLAKTGLPKTICLGDSVNLGDSAVKGNSYTWVLISKSVLGTSSILKVSPKSSTTFYLTETNNTTGCTKTDSVTVKVNPVPNAFVGTNHSICNGSSTIIGAAPITGHKYQWTSKPAGFASNQSNPTVLPKVNTTYYLTETDSAYGCSHSDSVQIKVNPLPTPNAGGDTVICAGSPVKLGSGQPNSYSYAWASIPAGFTSASRTISVNPIISTHYIVIATDSNGCSNSDTAFVKVNPLPQAYIGAKAICPGDSIQLGASPVAGHTYEWGSFPIGFSSTISNPVVKPTVATTYSLTEIDTITGCSKSRSGKVFINPVPKAANIGNKTICRGDRIAIGADAVAGSTYTWTSKPIGFVSNAANPIVSPAVNTIYYIKEINATGCINSDSLHIIVKPIPPKPFAGKDQYICVGNIATLSFNTVPGYSYRWTDISRTFTSTDSIIYVRVSYTNAYILTITLDTTGCSNSDTVIINAVKPPNPKIIGKRIFCGVDTATYTTALNGGDTYSWTVGFGNILSGQGTNKVLVKWLSTAPPGIAVLETDSTGCSNTDGMTIVINQKSIAHFSAYNGCTQQVIQFTDSSQFADSVSWNFGDGKKSGNRNPTHVYEKSGTYSVQEIAFTKEGCTDTFTKNIIVYPFPAIKLQVVHDTGYLYTFSTNDSAELVYSWDFGDNTISNRRTEMHNFKDNKIYNVHLTIANPNGCILALDTTINVFYYTDKDSISIFPNPFADHISIYERLKENTNFRLLIYDVIGQKVADISQWTRDAGIHTDIFDATGLAQGTYIVKLLVGDGEVIVKKMVKVGR